MGSPGPNSGEILHPRWHHVALFRLSKPHSLQQEEEER